MDSVTSGGKRRRSVARRTLLPLLPSPTSTRPAWQRTTSPKSAAPIHSRDAGGRLVEELRPEDRRAGEVDRAERVAAPDLEGHGLPLANGDIGAGVAHHELLLGGDLDRRPRAVIAVVAPEPVAIAHGPAAQVAEHPVRELDVVAAPEGRGACPDRRSLARADGAQRRGV